MREGAIFCFFPLPGHAFYYLLYTTCVPWCIALLIDIYLLFAYQKNVGCSLN